VGGERVRAGERSVDHNGERHFEPGLESDQNTVEFGSGRARGVFRRAAVWWGEWVEWVGEWVHDDVVVWGQGPCEFGGGRRRCGRIEQWGGHGRFQVGGEIDHEFVYV